MSTTRPSFSTVPIDPESRAGWSTWGPGAGLERWKLHTLLRGQRRLGVYQDDVFVTATEPPMPEVAILLGETGSGRTSLARWAISALAPDHSCGLVDLVSPEAANPNWLTEVSEGKEADRLKRASATEFASTLEGSDNGTPLTLFINDPSSLSPEVSIEAFGNLSRVVEGRRLNQIRLFFSVQDDAVMREGPFSEFTRLANVYRLGHLGPEELAGIWASGLGETTELPKPGAQTGFITESFEWTGGQPLLVQVLFDHLATQLLQRPTRPTRGDELLQPLRAAGEHLRHHPPLAVASWQRELAEITRDPRARGNVVALLRGQGLRRLSSSIHAERLFAGGWTRRAGNRWWIRSRCHQAWAREPLREPQAFLAGRAVR